MKTLPTQGWAVNQCMRLCGALGVGLALVRADNSIERTVKQIRFSTAPLQLPPSLPAKQRNSIARPESSQGVSFIPITFGTVVMAIFAWERRKMRTSAVLIRQC